jgi:hypothetical protein
MSWAIFGLALLTLSSGIVLTYLSAFGRCQLRPSTERMFLYLCFGLTGGLLGAPNLLEGLFRLNH